MAGGGQIKRINLVQQKIPTPLQLLIANMAEKPRFHGYW